MEWFQNLMFGNNAAHALAVFAIVIALGVALGKVKIFGISLGITWVLFVGIAFAHFGMGVEHNTLHFIKEFGLILFVYSIGLQVGPSFFSSLKKEGLKMNILAMLIVFLGVFTTLIIHFVSGTPISAMVGILSGAVTNTPGLGAAQETFRDIKGISDESISLGYAVAYPLGVIGVILTITFLRIIFRVDLKKEREITVSSDAKLKAHRISVILTNPNLIGKKIGDVNIGLEGRYVISRICRKNGEFVAGTSDVILQEGDILRIVLDDENEQMVINYFGERTKFEWFKSESLMEAKRVIVTNSSVVGKTLSELGLSRGYSFNITRINRAGIDLVARGDLALQMGDRATVVGMPEAVVNVEKILGNSLTKLRQPNLIHIFLGIFLGVIVGSIPFTFPGIPQAVKLGLAGGPLIVAILISRYGSKFKLLPWTTVSSNLMIREIGIALFLAGVGLGAGGEFVNTLLRGDGLKWVLYGAIITVVPTISVGIFARVFMKLDYFTIIGMLSGATTNPPALAYSNSISSCDRPNVAYSTVYPLTMFMRVMTAQLLILLFL